MKTCVQIFRAGVEDLHAFLDIVEHESELIGRLLNRHDVLEEQEKQLLSRIAAARTDRKRYVYSVAIISLYGFFERLVDTLIEAFIDVLTNSVNSYQMMPDAIKKNHIPMSLELAQAIAKEKERYRTGITQETVITNLHSCLSGALGFRVNGPAFVVHRGNITLQKVTNFLSSVGIENHFRRVTMACEMQNIFHQNEPERDISSVVDQELPSLLEPIDDLVERRNQVSHGMIDDIESTDLLKERCSFVNAYGGALYDVMLQESLKYQVSREDVQPLGKPIAVYNHSIVCFESESCHISTGGVLAAATGNPMEPFRYGTIISIQINHEQFPEITISQPTRFAAKVSFKASDNFDYYVLPEGVV